MEDQYPGHTTGHTPAHMSEHIEVVHNGADYLDGIVADMERQVAEMATKATETAIPEVRDGYERLVEVLKHCIHTLREKSEQLRH